MDKKEEKAKARGKRKSILKRREGAMELEAVEGRKRQGKRAGSRGRRRAVFC
jgi:hypothetical protein